jgi:hypothetical protein
MSLSSAYLTLLVGASVPLPAPARLMSALESVQVDESETLTSGFQLVFRAERSLSYSTDDALLSSPLLAPGNRVVITVTVNARPRVLADGIITRHEPVPSGGAAGTSLTVTGKDLTQLMEKTEFSRIYQFMSHEMIVGWILLTYAMYGIVPMIVPTGTIWGINPLEQATSQQDTDLKYLNQLAGQHNYIFGLKPGPLPLANVAYWGPRNRCSAIWSNPRQAPLSVDMGPATNVQSINFGFDPTQAAKMAGAAADPDSAQPVKITPSTSSRGRALASRPALQSNAGVVKNMRLEYRGGNMIEARARAQGQTDESAANVATVHGSLDVMRYGDLLSAPGVVGLRGAGQTYDGQYYIRKVTHNINRKAYTQSFELAREGTGSRVQKV